MAAKIESRKDFISAYGGTPAWINLHARRDRRGALIALEYGDNLPFELKRAFYIYDVPLDTERGGHAHKKCEQVLVAVQGSMDIVAGGRRYVLSSRTHGLYIPPQLKVIMENFSEDAVLLALASEKYDPADYDSTD